MRMYLLNYFHYYFLFCYFLKCIYLFIFIIVFFHPECILINHKSYIYIYIYIYIIKSVESFTESHVLDVKKERLILICHIHNYIESI